jgi:hypothetical protein
VSVTAFAANAAAIFAPVITATRCATRSAANPGNRSLCPSAQRYAASKVAFLVNPTAPIAESLTRDIEP